MQQNSRKVAIVTGSSRGIGRNIALKLASAGTKVIINYSSNRIDAQQVVEEIKQNSGEALAIKADIGKVSEIERLF